MYIYIFKYIGDSLYFYLTDLLVQKSECHATLTLIWICMDRLGENIYHFMCINYSFTFYINWSDRFVSAMNGKQLLCNL